MEIGLVGAELFHAERSTDMTEQIVAFRNFANAPRNELLYTSTPSPSWRGHEQVYLLHELHYLNTSSHLHVYQVIHSFTFSDEFCMRFSSFTMLASKPRRLLAPSFYIS